MKAGEPNFALSRAARVHAPARQLRSFVQTSKGGRPQRRSAASSRYPSVRASRSRGKPVRREEPRPFDRCCECCSLSSDRERAQAAERLIEGVETSTQRRLPELHDQRNHPPAKVSRVANAWRYLHWEPCPRDISRGPTLLAGRDKLRHAAFHESRHQNRWPACCVPFGNSANIWLRRRRVRPIIFFCGSGRRDETWSTSVQPSPGKPPVDAQQRSCLKLGVESDVSCVWFLHSILGTESAARSLWNVPGCLRCAIRGGR